MKSTVKIINKKLIYLMCLCLILLIINGCSLIKNVPENVKTPSQTSKTSAPQQENKKLPEPKIIQGLVNIKDIDNTVIVDLKYASTDNFTGKVIYPFKTCLLKKETAEKLKNVNKQLAKSGYRIKLYDGYRPPFAQEIFWNLVRDERFVANPSKGGSKHSAGGAVDLTITDDSGNELEMPSKFDDFTGLGSRNNKSMSDTARSNLIILTDAMTTNGFNKIDYEWWHYYDTNYLNYKTVNVDPKLFE